MLACEKLTSRPSLARLATLLREVTVITSQYWVKFVIVTKEKGGRLSWLTISSCFCYYSAPAFRYEAVGLDRHNRSYSERFCDVAKSFRIGPNIHSIQKVLLALFQVNLATPFFFATTEESACIDTG